MNEAAEEIRELLAGALEGERLEKVLQAVRDIYWDALCEGAREAGREDY
jgi:hypothetical protein